MCIWKNCQVCPLGLASVATGVGQRLIFWKLLWKSTFDIILNKHIWNRNWGGLLHFLVSHLSPTGRECGILTVLNVLCWNKLYLWIQTDLVVNVKWRWSIVIDTARHVWASQKVFFCNWRLDVDSIHFQLSSPGLPMMVTGWGIAVPPWHLNISPWHIGLRISPESKICIVLFLLITDIQSNNGHYSSE